MTVLFILLFAYVGWSSAACSPSCSVSWPLPITPPGWIGCTFATAGLMALGLSVFGSVFATQSQIYDAKDNGLLLSMPIPPRTILLSWVPWWS